MDVSESDVVVSLEIPVKTVEEAKIIYNTFSVDKEPKRGGVVKTITVEGNTLNVKFIAKETRKIRTSVKSFMSHLLLVVNTIQKFGPPILN